jgi:hypothetical protein
LHHGMSFLIGVPPWQGSVPAYRSTFPSVRKSLLRHRAPIDSG